MPLLLAATTRLPSAEALSDRTAVPTSGTCRSERARRSPGIGLARDINPKDWTRKVVVGQGLKSSSNIHNTYVQVGVKIQSKLTQANPSCCIQREMERQCKLGTVCTRPYVPITCNAKHGTTIVVYIQHCHIRIKLKSSCDRDLIQMLTRRTKEMHPTQSKLCVYIHTPPCFVLRGIRTRRNNFIGCSPDVIYYSMHESHVK